MLMASLLRKDKYVELMFSLKAGKLRHQVSQLLRMHIKHYTDCKDQVAKQFMMQKMQSVHLVLSTFHKKTNLLECVLDVPLCSWKQFNFFSVNLTISLFTDNKTSIRS